MNEFSLPLFHSKQFINKAIEINKQIQKSKITNFYFALPCNCSSYTGFEQIRHLYDNKNCKIEDYIPLIEYALEKGFDFIYLLNSPRPFAIENPDFPKQIEKLHFLLDVLKKTGVDKIRVSHPKMLAYLNFHFPEFKLYASTSFEFKTLKEYQNFLSMYSSVKQIVPSHDVNKNFKLLKNLKKSLPNTDIEIMADEGCMGGCPQRFAHSCEYYKENLFPNNDIFLSNFYFLRACSIIVNKSPVLHICKSNNIYPWEIDEYNKIGINKFKLTGRDITEYSNNYIKYLKGIDNIKNIENESISVFIYHVSGNNVLAKYKVKDIKPYLPDIKYFKKHGHLCASECKVECTYCYKCAKNILEKVHV